MASKSFTAEEIRQLKANPYTNWVTPGMLSFTKEFKAEFWKRYQAGQRSRDIMQDLGYDPDVLGDVRISGIQHLISKAAKSGKGFVSAPLSGIPVKRLTTVDYEPTKETVIQMQNEILYLKQEIEFLKKISSVRTTKK